MGVLMMGPPFAEIVHRYGLTQRHDIAPQACMYPGPEPSMHRLERGQIPVNMGNIHFQHPRPDANAVIS